MTVISGVMKRSTPADYMSQTTGDEVIKPPSAAGILCMLAVNVSTSSVLSFISLLLVYSYYSLIKGLNDATLGYDGDPSGSFWIRIINYVIESFASFTTEILKYFSYIYIFIF